MSKTDTRPNLIGFRIAHRTMRGDSRLLSRAISAIADGSEPCDRNRAEAVREYVAKSCTGIHHHHRLEDELLWPLLERSAGAAVDLSELTEDHSQLDPMLDEITEAAREFTRDRTVAPRLAKSLGALADLLDEHIEEEERTIFPIIDEYVSVKDWDELEAEVRRTGDARFELPRIERYARPEELAALRKAAGPVLVMMLALLRPGFRRRHRLVFGSLSDA